MVHAFWLPLDSRIPSFVPHHFQEWPKSQAIRSWKSLLLNANHAFFARLSVVRQIDWPDHWQQKPKNIQTNVCTKSWAKLIFIPLIEKIPYHGWYRTLFWDQFISLIHNPEKTKVFTIQSHLLKFLYLRSILGGWKASIIIGLKGGKKESCVLKHSCNRPAWGYHFGRKPLWINKWNNQKKDINPQNRKDLLI